MNLPRSYDVQNNPLYERPHPVGHERGRGIFTPLASETIKSFVLKMWSREWTFEHSDPLPLHSPCCNKAPIKNNGRDTVASPIVISQDELTTAFHVLGAQDQPR